jgi:hypothetical protein
MLYTAIIKSGEHSFVFYVPVAPDNADSLFIFRDMAEKWAKDRRYLCTLTVIESETGYYYNWERRDFERFDPAHEKLYHEALNTSPPKEDK